MNFKDILKTVGTGLISSLVPGGSAIVSVINGFLPSDKKLPENATGAQAQTAIDTLSPQDKAIVLTKEFDVKIEDIRADVSMFQALCEVDKTGNTTRPEIAKMMAQVVCFTIIVVVSMYAYAIASRDTDMILAVNDGWPMLTAIIATPTALLRAYFAMRTKEKQQKYQAATGVSAPLGILAGIFKR